MGIKPYFGPVAYPFLDPLPRRDQMARTVSDLPSQLPASAAWHHEDGAVDVAEHVRGNAAEQDAFHRSVPSQSSPTKQAD
jgi:hypothetical protein